MKSLIKAIDYIEIGWCFILLTSILFMLTLQIFCRFVLNSPLNWPEELSVLLACYLTFVGVSLVHRRKQHIAFTVLAERFGPKFQKAIDLVIEMVTIAIFLVIVITSISLQKMQSNFLYFAALPITKNYFTLPITICGCSMILNSIYFISQNVFDRGAE